MSSDFLCTRARYMRPRPLRMSKSGRDGYRHQPSEGLTESVDAEWRAIPRERGGGKGAVCIETAPFPKRCTIRLASAGSITASPSPRTIAEQPGCQAAAT